MTYTKKVVNKLCISDQYFHTKRLSIQFFLRSISNTNHKCSMPLLHKEVCIAIEPTLSMNPILRSIWNEDWNTSNFIACIHEVRGNHLLICCATIIATKTREPNVHILAVKVVIWCIVVLQLQEEYYCIKHCTFS